MREIELRTIEEALAAHDGNVSAAARQLGISRSTIYRRLGIAPGPH
jgi:transcriptional regulator of acetoin/glycerol metabolism